MQHDRNSFRPRVCVVVRTLLILLHCNGAAVSREKRHRRIQNCQRCVEQRNLVSLCIGPTFVDLRRLPDWCSAYGKLFNRRQRLQRLLSFWTSPQEGLHIRTTSPTLSCSCFVADSHDHLRVSTDVTQRRRDDNLQVI